MQYLLQPPKAPAANLPTSVVESIPVRKHKHRLAARRRRRKCKAIYGLKRKVLLINQFNETNTATSPTCPSCHKTAVDTAVDIAADNICYYTEGKVSHGGDWEYISNITGLTGKI